MQIKAIATFFKILEFIWTSFALSLKQIFSCSFIGYISSPSPSYTTMLIVKLLTIVILWTHGPISYENMSFWCMLLEPRQTTYHSNIVSYKIKCDKLRLPTLLGYESYSNLHVLVGKTQESTNWLSIPSDTKLVLFIEDTSLHLEFGESCWARFLPKPGSSWQVWTLFSKPPL